MANERRISVDIKGGWYNQPLHEIKINREFSEKVLELSDYYNSDAIIAHNEMIVRDDRVLTRLKNNLAKRLENTECHYDKEPLERKSEKLFDPVLTDRSPFTAVHHGSHRDRCNAEIHKHLDDTACKCDNDSVAAGSVHGSQYESTRERYRSAPLTRYHIPSDQ